MKYIKTYEMLQTEPEIGDYVICKETFVSMTKSITLNFIAENIGKIIGKCKCNQSDINPSLYIIEYENIPKEIRSEFDLSDNDRYYYNVRVMYEKEILHCAKDPKELEIYLAAKKYNL